MPVDFGRRRDLLKQNLSDWADLAAGWRDGRIKLALTQRLLHLRRDFAGLFERGSYEPLTVRGRHAAHGQRFVGAALKKEPRNRAADAAAFALKPI